MTSNAISEGQVESLTRPLEQFSEECDARAVAVCDIGGNILAESVKDSSVKIDTAAALAAGSMAATRELASVIGEPGFNSLCHRGTKSGLLIRPLGPSFLVLVIMSEKSIEGLVRLCLRKSADHLLLLLEEAEGQSVAAAGASGTFEVEEKQG